MPKGMELLNVRNSPSTTALFAQENGWRSGTSRGRAELLQGPSKSRLRVTVDRPTAFITGDVFFVIEIVLLSCVTQALTAKHSVMLFFGLHSKF